MKQNSLACMFVLALMVVAVACAPTKTAPLTADALKNAEYHLEYPAKGVAKLTDGKYEEEIVPGAASKLVAVPDGIAFGDLNGDGVEDGAIILATNMGGSGTFIDLATVLNQDGAPKHVATVNLGDRVQVKSIAIEPGVISLEMVTHGPDDPMCCPSQNVTEKYKLQGDQLVKVK